MLWKAEDHYTQAQVDDMKKLVEFNARRKELEKAEKEVKDRVKAYMTANNNMEVQLPDGDIISITESFRRTVTKKTKDAFIAELVGKGKNYLVVTSIEPDVDSIFAEVDAGMLDAAFVGKYIKSTPVQTLTIT